MQASKGYTCNVLEYLESSASKKHDKVAVIDKDKSCTYYELVEMGKKVGSYIASECVRKSPVAVFADKGVDTLAAFVGTVYGGCFYTLIDPSFPQERVQNILSVLQPVKIISNMLYEEQWGKLGDYQDRIVTMDELVSMNIDEELLEGVRVESSDMDPLYCNFTSGSTGVSKGVLVGHRSVIDFIEHFTDIFDITETDVIGNQAPFDFDVSVKDIYSAFKTGATLVIIPKEYFSFPNNVVDMLDNYGVTTLIWAVSALCMVNRLHAFSYKVPQKINKIMFSGEVMPIKQLNQIRNIFPDAMFVNLYGPTEITCNCMYYVLDRDFQEGERLPLGIPFPNEEVFLLTEDKRVTEVGTKGEICVAGSSLALGYYNNPEQTGKAFVQNPLVKGYPQRIYKTGDLAAYGEDGNLYFEGRADFQIKHMGHRIELEEIERYLNSIVGVDAVCCLFNEKRGLIYAFYEGDEDRKAISDALKEKVPDFMVPNVFKCMDKLPLSKNGKIDRKALGEMM